MSTKLSSFFFKKMFTVQYSQPYYSICARCNTVIIIFSPLVIYCGVILMPLFASQKANFTAISLSKNAERSAVVDFTQTVEADGNTFLLKRTKSNVVLASTADLANKPNMNFGVVSGGMVEGFFRDSSDHVDKTIWRNIKVSGTMLSNDMGNRSNPL